MKMFLILIFGFIWINNSVIKISSNYLETIQRKLFHSRDIGEKFDFLAWFEFEPKHKSLFDDLLGYLRQTEEWKYVTREIDIRVIRD